MAAQDLWTRSAEEVARDQIKDYLTSIYGPRPEGDVHGHLIGAGGTLGGVLGSAFGGRIGGRFGAATGFALGDVAGRWAAHGAYREGQLINDILTHPENWTVDAAGAIVPVLPAPAPPPARYEQLGQRRRSLSAQSTQHG